MKALRIQKASIEEANILAEMGERTFRDTYHQFNRPEDMESYVGAHFTLSQITQELQEPGVTFLLAHEDGRKIGYVKLRKKSPPVSAYLPAAVELERIYVERSAIGQGLGSTLMRAAIEEADRAGYQSIWLGVWEKNERAVRFYKKWEFQVIGSHEFTLGADAQTDFVMARPIVLSQ